MATIESELPISIPSAAPGSDPSTIWEKLRLPHFEHDHPPVKNANDVYQEGLKPLDKLAVAITDRVGSMGFFITILVWTIVWTGFNIVTSDLVYHHTTFFRNTLHWHDFDPFPSFVAYLLISNVIQILLMPLIMVGQNVQGHHSEIRAQLDYEINQKAEKEVVAILRNLEHNTDLVLQLMRHLECRVSEEEIRAITAEKELAEQLAAVDPTKAAEAA